MAKEAIFVQDGNAIDVTLAADVVVGEVMVMGELVGVANNTGLTGEVVAMKISGVWEMKAKDADEVTVGAKVYWDADEDELTTTATDNTQAGLAVTAKAAATAGVVNVKLGA